VAFAAEAFEGTITDLYIPEKKKTAHHSVSQQNICGLKKNSTVTSFIVSSRTCVRDLIRY